MNFRRVAPGLGLNGIDVTTGRLIVSDKGVSEIAGIARKTASPELAFTSMIRTQRDLDELAATSFWMSRGDDESGRWHRGWVPWMDPTQLSSSGWGVIFPADGNPVDRESLTRLLNLRRRQAAAHYREFSGARGYRPGEDCSAFLARHGVKPGMVDPNQLPYYLLLVGSPGQIPYSFQSDLDVQYAVGRLDLECPDDYESYSDGVIQAASGSPAREGRLSMFAVTHPDDPVTQVGYRELVSPLFERLSFYEQEIELSMVKGQDATQRSLLRLLEEGRPGQVIFTLSHGVSFPFGHPLQRSRQGGVLCADWTGPPLEAEQVSARHYLSADDLTREVCLNGQILFLHGCFTAGTPHLGQFSNLRTGNWHSNAQEALCRQPFTARLAQQLLARPGRGALAVIGHCDQTWTAGHHLPTFERLLVDLLRGRPVGLATECLGQRYGELAVRLLRRQNPWSKVRESLARFHLMLCDAGTYTLLGDPAVSLPVRSKPRPEKTP